MRLQICTNYITNFDIFCEILVTVIIINKKTIYEKYT
jgi:hypothetical protein